MSKILPAVIRFGGHFEKGVCYAALILMALLPVTVAALRPFNIAIAHSGSYLIHLFLVAGLFAAMITTQRREHITVSVIQYSKNDHLKKNLSIMASLISSIVLTILFWNCLTLFGQIPEARMVGVIPESFFILLMALAYGIMAIRFALNACIDISASNSKNYALKAAPLLAIIFGSILALPAIAKFIWGFDVPDPFYSWVNDLYDAAFLIGTPIILLLIASAFAGVPIFVAIGAIALVMLQAGGREPETASIHIYSAFTNSNLIAIPLFTLTGFFLSESKAGERLVAAFKNLFSWLPGGTIIATVVICAFFTSFTGASGVTILALGGILFIILQKSSAVSGGKGYPEKFSLGLLTSVGGIGILFPPSLPIILVATTVNSILFFMGEPVQYDVIDFFLGAILPGIILVLAMVIYGIVASKKVKVPVEPFKPKETALAIKGSAFEILLPLVLVGGYFSGILTLVEISAVSVVYVFIVQVFIHRDIPLRDVPKVLFKAVPIIGGIISILAMAQALSYSVIYSQVPANFAAWMHTAVQSPILFLLLLNIALLLLGSFMDIFSAILVVLPLVVPLALMYGIDPVHLGIIFIVNLEAGFLTPPVGMNLFMASYRFKKPFMEICRNVLPFLGVRMIVVLLVTYIPWFSSALINLFR